MYMNDVKLLAIVINEPKTFGEGENVARTKVKVPKKMNKEQREKAIKEGKPIFDYIPIIAFGKYAKVVAGLNINQKLVLTGSLETTSYVDKGTQIKKYDWGVVLSDYPIFLNNTNELPKSTEESIDEIYEDFLKFHNYDDDPTVPDFLKSKPLG